jgi:hypothetical protein
MQSLCYVNMGLHLCQRAIGYRQMLNEFPAMSPLMSFGYVCRNGYGGPLQLTRKTVGLALWEALGCLIA